MNTKYNKLFEPFTFVSGVTIDNWIIMSPVTTDSAFEMAWLRQMNISITNVD